MDLKEGVILGVFVIFVLPSLIGVLWWSAKVTSDPGNPEHLEEGAELMVKNTIPWWLGIFEWLAGLPGAIGVVLIIGLVFFLKWIGEIK